MRADTLREYATEARFSTVDILDVERPQFRLYQLSLQPAPVDAPTRRARPDEQRNNVL
jgi:hypothetical protein